MVKSLTIGLVDDGVATWNPVSDGNLLVTGGAGCGKTWWLTHTLIPGLTTSHLKYSILWYSVLYWMS